jgi:cytochrome P450
MVSQKAQEIVDRVTQLRSFDAIKEIALSLPISVIEDFVGYPPDHCDKLSVLGYDVFNAFGPPDNELLTSGLEKMQEMMTYLLTEATPAQLKPDSAGADIYAAADRGDIDFDEAVQMMVAYTTAGMDTTMSAIGTAIQLFGTFQNEWHQARENQMHVRAAMNEILRYDAPIQWFSRLTLSEYEVAGSTIPANSRVILYMGSANRDERKWENPDDFDISREAGSQLAFGYGLHLCAGQALARLEFEEIFWRLAKRVRNIDVVSMERPVHNVLRSIRSLNVTLDLDD